RLIHTADWHLGQTLHGVDRAWEHDRFLDWLLDQLVEQAADALIIAGDVFDVAHPTSRAQGQYYRFVAEARQRMPNLTIAVVGGNHDSPARLDAPRAVLGALGVTVVGGLPKAAPPDLVPLTNKDGETEGWLLPVPFLRPRDLPRSLAIDPTDAGQRTHDRLIQGHRSLYRQLVDRALTRRTPGQALVATGHCYMAGGHMSDLSERKIQVGHQHALPVDIFPPELTYVALGHLHRAQSVGDAAHIRYSGSPLPLSLAERDYPHQVLRIDIEDARIQAITPLMVPRTIDILRIPETPAPLEEVLPMLTNLPRRSEFEGVDERRRPYLEVRIQLERAQPRLRQDVAAALVDAWPRLLRIDAVRNPTEASIELPKAASLDRLTPDEVFDACYRRTRDREPTPAQRALFATLVESVQREESP
ncbi:MAG: exonuclease SbcCD subunit D C-terminal domain-containing protein, partial [Myxococcota bacterium]